jgi:phage terminase large subunit-like protein
MSIVNSGFEIRATIVWALDFFPAVLRHVEGDLGGQPFRLEHWQQAILANLFGWQRIDKRGRTVRRFKEVFLYVPRKNGKTPFAAGLCLYVLVCDGEKGAQIYGAASAEEQATLLYRQACGMVEQSKALSRLCMIYKGRGSQAIQLRADRASSYRVVTSKPKGKHGGTSHMVLIDELHAIDKREIVDVFETSFASDNRPQPIYLTITTADYERPSVCNEKLGKAKRVRDNDGDRLAPGWDPQFLPVVYETERGADWENPAVWRAANPNFGVSVSEEFFERFVRDIKETPSKLDEFLRLHLNMVTQTSQRWLDTAIFDQMVAKSSGFDWGSLAGRRCYGGLDLSSTRDLVSFVLVFPVFDGPFSGFAAVKPFFWVPEESARQRSKRDSVPYEAWIRSGYVRTCPGNATDYPQIRRDILEISAAYGMRRMAIDRLFQGEETAQNLMADGLDVKAFGQGFVSMAAPCKRFEEEFYAGKFLLEPNPVLRWNVGNVVTETDAAGNKKPSKEKSSEKIDGIVSWIMAFAMSMLRDEAPILNYYETGSLESG